jgi:hypothetical protein
VLRRKFGPKRDGIKGGRRKLHKEELRNYHFSPNIVRMIKSRKMRWACHVAHVREKRNEKKKKGFGGKPEEKRDH